MNKKTLQYGNEGEELVPGKTENLSSALHKAGHAAEVDAKLGKRGGEEAQPDQFDRREEDLPGRPR